MEFKLYNNSDGLLIESTSSSSKESWTLSNEIIMDNGDEYFGWNSLKIDENDASVGNVGVKKRKLSTEIQTERKIRKDSLFTEKTETLKNIHENGKDSIRMPQWQVDDYGDIQNEIDNSLNLESDLASHQNTYSNESMLNINGMTVFKQEAPSPTLNDVTQMQRLNNNNNNRQSPTSSTQPNVMGTPVNSSIEENSQSLFNNTINQLLNQSALVNIHSVIDNGNLTTSPNSQDSFVVSSTNYNLIEDCRFQYVLAAATSIATKQNEDTLTYLNQGQSYEVKLKKLGDLSMYRGKLLKSIIRICFHERRLQYMEKEQMESWQKARPGDRILEVDVPLSYGAFDITQPNNTLNVINFVWDPTKEVGVYIKVNCISTEFTPKKHGGEKGVPFRIQVETYQNGESLTASKRLHAAACQIKVFKLKGADRKHKQDREKILKRPLVEQEKYQPSYDCTVLNDIPNDAVLITPSLNISNNMVPFSGSDNGPEFTRITPTSPHQQHHHQIDHSTLIPQNILTQNSLVNNNNNSNPQSPDKKDDGSTNDSIINESFNNNNNNNQLTQYSNPDETVHWLTANRFEKYLDIFSRFSGSDMLRMSRDDVIQICGHADGIRLHNALHLRAIAPKLKIYVCRDSTMPIFNVLFLTSYNQAELLQKLCSMVSINQEQVKAIYLEGPQNIRIQLNDDFLKHIDDETMFTLNIVRENHNDNNYCYVFLLKRKVKQ